MKITIKANYMIKSIILLCASILMVNSSVYAAPVVKDSIIGLYVAYYNRAPDQDGVNFWVNQASLNGNSSALLSISEGFSNHPKFREDYPDTDTTSQFVTKIYNNILNRSPDIGGLEYWVSLIDDGLPKTEFIVNYTSNVLDYDGGHPDGIKSKQMFVNKVTVGKYFIDTLAADSNGQPGTEAYSHSIDALSGVTEDMTTVDSAENKIRGYLSTTPVIQPPTKK
jgi:hypothetical protein